MSARARSWSERAPAGAVPALLVLLAALTVVLLRPPLPVDETRYLEVFRESLDGSHLLLRLCGEPYAEKPPLLFWLGALLEAAGLPAGLALRCIPALASAALVLVVARLGRSAGLALAGWCQAALLLPLVAGQLLLFDALLALAVWCAVDAWTRRRDAACAVWSAAALLAKGPVALLFLVPFLWCTVALRGPRAGDGRRAAALLALALVPLAAWALAAARLGGPEFADALLWDRWASRVGGNTDHARGLFFYVPVVLVGALPGTFLLLRRRAGEAPAGAPETLPERRFVASLLSLLLAFTLFRGKQAHYLVPAAPAAALLLARRLADAPGAITRLLAGARVQLGALAALSLAGLVALPRLADSFGARGRELLASGGWRLPLVLAALGSLAGLAWTLRARSSARAILCVVVASTGASLVALHRLAGELLYPHALAAALAAEPSAPVAYLGTAHHGLYALLAARSELEKLEAGPALSAWIAAHPGGLLLIDSRARLAALPAGLVPVARDLVHRSEVDVYRAVPTLAHAPR